MRMHKVNYTRRIRWKRSVGRRVFNEIVGPRAVRPAINTLGHRTRARLSVGFFFFLHIFNSRNSPRYRDLRAVMNIIGRPIDLYAAKWDSKYNFEIKSCIRNDTKSTRGRDESKIRFGRSKSLWVKVNEKINFTRQVYPCPIYPV